MQLPPLSQSHKISLTFHGFPSGDFRRQRDDSKSISLIGFPHQRPDARAADAKGAAVQIPEQLVHFPDVKFVVFRAVSQIVLATESLVDAVTLLKLFAEDE